MTQEFQQCGKCDQQRLRPACAYAQSDQSLCKSLECSMNVQLLAEQTAFGVSNLKRRQQRLVCIYTCQGATLLEITCLENQPCNYTQAYIVCMVYCFRRFNQHICMCLCIFIV